MSYASSAIKRLSNEYRHLQKPENRVSDYFVAPLEQNIFEWHFTLRGPAGEDKSLPYKDGLYHGALIFSRSYPLEPPDIMFFTRSGRFATHEKICSTISSYHKELWQPTYDIALTLSALRHFMAQEDEFGVGAFPKNMVATETKVAWARETWSFACTACGRTTKEVWESEMKDHPETSAEKEALVPRLPPPAAAAAASPASPAQTASPSVVAAALVEGAPAPSPAAASPVLQATAPSPQEKLDAARTKPPLIVNESPAPVAGSPAVSAAPPQDEHSDTNNNAGMADEEDAVEEVDKLDELVERHTAVLAKGPADQWRSVGRGAAAAVMTDDMQFNGEDEDGVPRRCYLTELPTLNTEEARQLAESADKTRNGIPDIRLEPVLRAEMQREAREVATVAPAAAEVAELPPPPPPPAPPANPLMQDVFPGLADIVEHGFVNDLAADPPTNAAAHEAPPQEQQQEQQQRAENAVFGIHNYRISIPLKVIDRAIIWSFGVVVIIVMRRAVSAIALSLWDAK